MFNPSIWNFGSTFPPDETYASCRTHGKHLTMELSLCPSAPSSHHSFSLSFCWRTIYNILHLWHKTQGIGLFTWASHTFWGTDAMAFLSSRGLLSNAGRWEGGMVFHANLKDTYHSDLRWQLGCFKASQRSWTSSRFRTFALRSRWIKLLLHRRTS